MSERCPRCGNWKSYATACGPPKPPPKSLPRRLRAELPWVPDSAFEPEDDVIRDLSAEFRLHRGDKAPPSTGTKSWCGFLLTAIAALLGAVGGILAWRIMG